jgi:3-hydroxyisobutyrate dehydrogenase-like beta-hydroxyacid dehydrogenase
MKIAFIGLGNMGLPMASNLMRAGHEMVFYNRTRSRAEELKKTGGRVAATPAEAAATAEVAITMLADDAAVESVVFGSGGGSDGLLATLKPGAIHISMSTISVELAQRLVQAHSERGQQLVSAPVFGRPEAAQEAKLFIVAAGPAATLRTCEPLLASMGQKTFVVGENPPAGNVVKLSGNFLIASVIEGLAEATALIRKYGIDPQTYLDVLNGSLFGAAVYKTYGSRIASDNFEPVGFRMPLGLKDIRLTLAAAEKASVPMPFASHIRDQMVSAIARGLQDSDWSAFARIAALNAGLPSKPKK